MNRRPTLLLLLLALGLSGAAAAQENEVQSDNALAYLNIDIEKSPGWVAKVKGGYQWKLFRGVGLEVRDPGTGNSISHRGNHTKDGLAGSVSLGYNFAQLPLTLGLQFGLGPSGKMSRRTDFSGGSWLFSRQKVSISTLDLTADYDFRNCSRWTPFIGVAAGAAFVSQKGNAVYRDAALDIAEGALGKHSRVNFMTGARAGVKYDITDRITLSLYGSYNYLGKVPSKSYILRGVSTYEAKTKKITAHSVDLKAGLRFSF